MSGVMEESQENGVGPPEGEGLEELSLSNLEIFIDEDEDKEREERDKVEVKEDGYVARFENDNQLAHDRGKKKRSLDVQSTGDEAQYTFENLGLKREILSGLKREQFFTPSPIQVKAIPFGKFGYDLIMQSKSGTGKTCAFGVIVLEQLDLSSDAIDTIQAIILAPTREIADQNKDTIRRIGGDIHGLKVKVFIGGTSVEQSFRRSKLCNVVSGTPGRILHLIKEEKMDLSQVKIVVLDEADRLMEASFMTDILAIFEALPKEKQVIAASATYPDGLKEFVKQFMESPMDVTTGMTSNLLYVGLYAADVSKILELSQPVKQVEEISKNKMKVMWQILQTVEYTQAIIFSRYVLKAKEIYDSLKMEEMDVALLTGGQSQESRLNALRDTKDRKCKILVCSDLGTRGIDCEGVDLVINFDIPDDISTYVHRFGRAGRFGSFGTSITLLSYSGEIRILSGILDGSNLNVRLLQTKEQLANIGKKGENLRKIQLRKERTSQQASGNENWNEVLDLIMKAPLDYPSLEMESFAGFTLDVDFDDVMKKVQNVKERYGA